MTELVEKNFRDEAAVFNQEVTVQSWDDDYYHPLAIAYYDSAIPQMLRDMGAKPGDQVLDAGCGPGVHSIRAARYGCDMTAIDLSSTMLKHAAERAKQAGVAEKIAFQQADITAPNLARTFDYVFSWGVIIHVPDTHAALEGLMSLVAPKGKLTLQILNEASFDYRVETLLRKLLRKPFKEPVEAALGSGNWYSIGMERLWVLRFDMKALDAMMQQRGFRLESRRTAEFSEFQRRLPGFLRKPMLHLNRLFYERRIGTNLSATQIVTYSRQS
jgi:2-polyprenyl-3-methyl-5-hydroxy-6-metoxy-1,4-benzoquinol methylase